MNYRLLGPREGIEPPLTVLETAALPLYYPGIDLIVEEDLNRRSLGYKPSEFFSSLPRDCD